MVPPPLIVVVASLLLASFCGWVATWGILWRYDGPLEPYSTIAAAVWLLGGAVGVTVGLVASM